MLLNAVFRRSGGDGAGGHPAAQTVSADITCEAGVGGATSLDDGASQVPGQGDGAVGDAEASENDGAVADFGSEIDFEAAGEAALDAEPEPAVF